jgi:hypothetical protein
MENKNVKSSSLDIDKESLSYFNLTNFQRTFEFSYTSNTSDNEYEKRRFQGEVFRIEISI